MAIYKCEGCGSDIMPNEGQSVVVCEYCSTKNAIPQFKKDNSDKLQNLYDRANHFRRENNYDKAMGIYESILNDDNTVASAYWGVVLCKFGIEYVEDPKTKKVIPTCNRTQFKSIFLDEDYKAAIEYADEEQRAVYEDKAKVIDNIQKGILAISQNEEPFDVFISYKETDENGRRTHDSVIAQELYYGLVEEGYKVFFSRITLEDKLGTEYEPYIFAALNSSKVMVALGTKPEYFNAVWVRNEWSRYLALINNGERKVLIPAYKDMDAYDLPMEFGHLQAQDMSKLGFLQDLVRGIKKIVKKEEPKPVETAAPSVNVELILERAEICVEDGEFDKAEEFCEQVLSVDPKNSKAYILQLLCDLKLNYEEDLGDVSAPYDGNVNYKRAVRYSDEAKKKVLEGYLAAVKAKSEVKKPDPPTDTNTYTPPIIVQTTSYAPKPTSQNNSAVSENRATLILGEYGGEKIKWRVLEKDGDKALIITDKVIDAKAFDSNNGNVWANSSLRIWLNSYFVRAAFNESERDQIVSTATESGCFDRAFLLSIDEVNKYFTDSQRRAEGTAFAQSKGLYVDDGFAWWWLRSRGNGTNYAARVTDNGYIDDFGERVLNAYYGVRPAMWIQLPGSSVGQPSPVEKKPVSPVSNPERLIKFAIDSKFGKAEMITSKTEPEFLGEYGGEKIKWRVLKKDGDKALIITDKIIDTKRFDRKSNVWANSEIRKWLNNDFINNAFNTSERARIISVATERGCSDKVFLLSVDEAKKYFDSDSQRQTDGTAFAKRNGLYADNKSKKSWWWLRSLGSGSNRTARVNTSGDLFSYGINVDYTSLGVRPAMWIKI